MNLALAEAPVITSALMPNWAETTATTVEREIPHISGTSEIDRALNQAAAFPVVHYARIRSRSFPAHAGAVMLFEGALEQVGYVEDAITTSTVVYRFMAPHPRIFLLNYPQYRPLLPSAARREEDVDWDASIGAAPQGPSGKLMVTLKYGGIGAPTPPDSYWND